MNAKAASAATITILARRMITIAPPCVDAGQKCALAVGGRDRRRLAGSVLIQRVERFLQHLADVTCIVGIDHVGVEIEIQPGHMLAENMNGLAGGAENAAYRKG